MILQTRHPDHPALAAASRHDYEAFAEAELAERAAAGYPPTTRLVSFLVSGPREERVIEAVERLAEWARDAVGAGEEVEVLGPAPHVWTKLRGRFRWHVTLRSARRRLFLESASGSRTASGRRSSRPGFAWRWTWIRRMSCRTSLPRHGVRLVLGAGRRETHCSRSLTGLDRFFTPRLESRTPDVTTCWSRTFVPTRF